MQNQCITGMRHNYMYTQYFFLPVPVQLKIQYLKVYTSTV